MTASPTPPLASLQYLQEMSSYFSSLGPAALQASVSGTVDLDAFGHGVQEWVAVMSKLALCCKEADPNSADAEQLL